MPGRMRLVLDPLLYDGPLKGNIDNDIIHSHTFGKHHLAPNHFPLSPRPRFIPK